MQTKKAVVLLSGGLDSLTCVAIAQAEGYEVYALSFSYGQRHSVELEAAKRIAQKYKVREHKIIPLQLNLIGGSALTNENIDVPNYSGKDEIPTTYVPARNTIFLSIALGYAEVVGADTIIIGANSIDYSGYPDCRLEYMEAFQRLAGLATKAGVEGNPVKIYAPLIKLTKAQIIKKGIELGVDYGLSISCYQSDAEGKACGHCDSCHFRKQGFINAGVKDPTRYQDKL